MADNSSIKEREGFLMVSVIMPAYHCAGTIRKAIESVLYQDVDVELLIIDDCSDDGLEEICKEYGENPAVKYIRNEKNLGAAESRNKGIALATGKYTAFLDADDWWDKEKLKKQIHMLEKTGDVLCCTARELITPDGRETGRVIPVQEKISYRQLLHHNSINCSSVLIRTEVLKEYRMEHEDSHEDYILWMKILKKYQQACGINEPLLKYRLSTTGKSGNKLKSARMTYTAYRYAGHGIVAAAWYFCSYACHGVWKYLMSRFGGNR